MANSNITTSALPLDDPNVIKEIEAQFADYNRALRENDLAALNGYS